VEQSERRTGGEPDARLLWRRWRFNGNPPSAVYRPSSDVPGITNRGSIIACPAYHEGRVYLAMGQDPTHGDGMGRLYAIAANGTGDVTHRGRLWEYTDLHRTICTPIIQDGLVYVGDNYGVVHCVDAQTGKRVWAHDQKGRIWGCMVMAGNCLYVGDESGRIVVYRACRELDILARIDMPAPLYGAPAVAGDTMFLATTESLYAIRQLNSGFYTPARASAASPARGTTLETSAGPR
jgi:outer membrane protein assembly factor BamB